MRDEMGKENFERKLKIKKDKKAKVKDKGKK
jgi:hypothetical protein